MPATTSDERFSIPDSDLQMGQYVVKLVVAALDTPLFYVISGLVEA